jgi:D-methionine transport system substrate-binding protein
MHSRTYKKPFRLNFIRNGEAEHGEAPMIVIRPIVALKSRSKADHNRVPSGSVKSEFVSSKAGISRGATSSLLVALFVLMSLAGCDRHQHNTLRVGVTPGPAGEILESIRSNLKGQGIDLQIVSFTDYIQPDLALAGHDLDANLYQNVAFLSQFNHDHQTNFIEVTKVYLPLMALYPGRSKSLTGLNSGARVAVPNDPVNLSRALHLLDRAGLIVLQPGAGSAATVADVAQNPKQLKIIELDAAQLPRSLDDVDLAVINANFALDAGLHPKTNSLFCEGTDSPFANVLAVNAESRDDAGVRLLVATLSSQGVREFISKRYKGAIYPAL